MSRYRKFMLLFAGSAVVATLAHAQVPTVTVGKEEFVSSLSMERPSVATDSINQPHFVCDPGGNRFIYKFHRVKGKWQGGVFAEGSLNGRYSASRLYIGQMEIDAKDRAWISCKFGCKEYGSMLGQGVWLYRNITTAPVEQMFRHVNVYKGMGVVSLDAKYPDQGVVLGTFGNFRILSQYGENLGSGSINAGHGGEKVRMRIASYAPKYRAKGDTKAYPDGIWHTAMNGGPIDSMYQNSARYKAGLGPVPWASKYAYPEMGDDYHHPGIGIDATNPKMAYIASVFLGNLYMNIWDGSKMLFPINNLKVIDYGAAFEIRHAPSMTPAPGTQGGVFIFWSESNRIRGVYVSKKGVPARPFDVGYGRSAGATTDREGNIHVVYMGGNGIKYRKIQVATLQALAPQGVVVDRTPRFRWTDTHSATYTIDVTKDGERLFTRGGIKSNTWTPAADLGVGVYSWRVKEGLLNSANKWATPSLTFTIKPDMPDSTAPEGRISDSPGDTSFEWTSEDPDVNRFQIQLYKDSVPQGLLSVTGDVKSAFTTSTNLTAGSYLWKMRSVRTHALSKYTLYSGWTPLMSFQIGVPGAPVITDPVANAKLAPGSQVITPVWSEPAGIPTAYTLELVLNGSTLATFPGVTTNCPINRNFTPGYHTLLVAAENGSGDGPKSAPVTFIVTRDMVPGGYAVRKWPPKEFQWTRSPQATKYLVKLARYDWSKKKYVLQREAWVNQPKWGAPKWGPTYKFPDGRYRWTVTDYIGAKQCYSSMAFFSVRRP